MTTVRKADWDRIVSLREQGENIQAIKHLRTCSGLALTGAKEIVIDHNCDQSVLASFGIFVKDDRYGEKVSKTVEIMQLIFALKSKWYSEQIDDEDLRLCIGDIMSHVEELEDMGDD